MCSTLCQILLLPWDLGIISASPLKQCNNFECT